jgi:hypothetical protein
MHSLTLILVEWQCRAESQAERGVCVGFEFDTCTCTSLHMSHVHAHVKHTAVERANVSDTTHEHGQGLNPAVEMRWIIRLSPVPAPACAVSDSDMTV